jgi:predicted exporter
MLVIFEDDENVKKLKIMNFFETATTLFVSIKGFSNANRNKLLQIEKELQSFDFVTKTTFNTSKIEISDYMKKNYYLLSEFNGIALDEKNIETRIKALKASLLDSLFYAPIDKNDPFKLFTFNLKTQEKMSKNSFLTLGERGYLLTAELNAKLSNMENAQAIEAKLFSYFENKEEVLAFSTLFFTAQNSKIIKSSVHIILYISFALLILLFFITLRDYKLLLANSITLASSIFFSLAISTYLFTELSIFTLAFGAAISSMSVDYLFHNYFHGQYTKRGINYSIMWAFLTTLLGFFMLQFVAFPLIKQLAIFAMLSLSFSYFQFTFLYPYLKLEPKEKRLNILKITNLKRFLSTNFVFSFSILIIVYAGFNLQFDYNFQNLDYDNKTLNAQKRIIEEAMPKKSTLLIEADSLNLLILRSKILKEQIPSAHSLANFSLTQELLQKKLQAIEVYDFSILRRLLNESANELGFKEGYFSDAYIFSKNIPKIYEPKIDDFKELGYEVIKKEGKFYTIATILSSDVNLLKEIEGIYFIDSASLLKSSLIKMFESLLFYLFISFVSIVFIIFFIVKKKVILALNFILFPLAMILLYLSFVQVNIMHLFSIIIIVVAGIDYGIYRCKENSARTNEAILYSLFTTFSGFGILVLSSIGAIRAIGEVITLGILSILFLILFLNNK